MGAFDIVTQFGRMLENLDAWLDKGAAYAKEPFMSLQMSVPGGAAATPGVSVAITGVKENP